MRRTGYQSAINRLQKPGISEWENLTIVGFLLPGLWEGRGVLYCYWNAVSLQQAAESDVERIESSRCRWPKRVRFLRVTRFEPPADSFRDE